MNAYQILSLQIILPRYFEKNMIQFKRYPCIKELITYNADSLEQLPPTFR